MLYTTRLENTKNGRTRYGRSVRVCYFGRTVDTIMGRNTDGGPYILPRSGFRARSAPPDVCSVVATTTTAAA